MSQVPTTPEAWPFPSQAQDGLQQSLEEGMSVMVGRGERESDLPVASGFAHGGIS